MSGMVSEIGQGNSEIKNKEYSESPLTSKLIKWIHLKEDLRKWRNTWQKIAQSTGFNEALKEKKNLSRKLPSFCMTTPVFKEQTWFNKRSWTWVYTNLKRSGLKNKTYHLFHYAKYICLVGNERIWRPRRILRINSSNQNFHNICITKYNIRSWISYMKKKILW